MTAHQWMFHYKECMRAKERRDKKERNILSLLETFAMYSHPSLDLGKLQSKIQERRINETVADVEGDLEEQANVLRESIPAVITVTEDKKEQKPVLKTMKVPAKRKKKHELEES